jgi:hypothetical protein
VGSSSMLERSHDIDLDTMGTKRSHDVDGVT